MEKKIKKVGAKNSTTYYSKKRMYKNNNTNSVGSMKSYKVTEGETIEDKVHRMTVNKEPIKETMKGTEIFTERKLGVLPATNIRTDRFDVAIDGMDIVHKSTEAKRAENLKTTLKKVEDKKEENKGSGAPSSESGN